MPQPPLPNSDEPQGLRKDEQSSSAPLLPPADEASPRLPDLDLGEENADTTDVPFANDATDIFFPSQPEPSDEAPTVISRTPPRGASSEDVFSGTLRGRRLAHFELIEPIGVGGMAAVIRARDLQLERPVALKILPPEMAADEENVRRFHQEARAAARLDHENIARVFFCGEDQKLHFIAFEFVEGVNLRTLIERRGRLPVPDAINFMLQVATGLAHAAQRGVIHRDIKPSNIIISPNGRAKLVDMGLARQLDTHKDLGLTQSGVTLGTFDYISPEQALEPRDADIRSDLYSLGCTFYHALTGQPPVPEGTAAKKLQHHQHVAPVDPRQLNPDIPDEVAGILARTMAKDPKDRYQRPEHLVQHLLQVARKLGTVAEVPDGVLFVDAPLPSPPRPRPLLLAVVAAVGLVGLIVLLGQTSVTPTPSDPGLDPMVSTTAPAGPRTTPAAAAPDPSPPPSSANATVAETPKTQETVTIEAATAKDLADALKHAAGKGQQVIVPLGGNLEIKAGDAAEAGLGLVFEGTDSSTLILKGKENKSGPEMPTIRLVSDGHLPPLTVKGGHLILDHVRLVLDATGAPLGTMAALAREGGTIQAYHCEFVQTQGTGEGSSVSSVVISGPPSGASPVAEFRHCAFLGAQTPAFTQVGGQTALTLGGGGQITLYDCAFGPHAVLLDVPADNAQVEMKHCSALLTGACTVVRVASAAVPTFKVEDCIFSHPKVDDAPDTLEGVLIQEALGGRIAWHGTANCYHNLDAFWRRPPEDPVLTLYGLQRFQAALQQGEGRGEETGSELLENSPWQSEDPLPLLAGFRPEALTRAFEVNAATAQKWQKDTNKRGELPGILVPPWRTLPYPTAPGKTQGEVTHHREKMVDPGLRGESGRGQYRQLSQAIEDAESGDTILIRSKGKCELKSVQLDAGKEITVKPAPGWHPVLTLVAGSEDSDPALFRLAGGKLHLEGLEFLLRPSTNGFSAQSLVMLVGEAECTFKDCVLTLDGTYGVPLTAVTLPALKQSRGARTACRFERCFVRGEGDLVTARVPRPFELSVDQSLLALSGSMLNVTTPDDAPPAPDDQTIGVQLSHVTAYLMGNLVRLGASKDIKGLLPVTVKRATNCLFVSAGGKALIHLDGDVSNTKMPMLLRWQQGEGNAYTNFPQMLDQQPPEGLMSTLTFAAPDWKEFTQEKDGQFNSVKLAETPTNGLTQVVPGQFKTKPNPQMCGANLDQVPTPVLDGVARAEP